MKIRFLVALVCCFILLSSCIASGETFENNEERSWKEVFSGWLTGGNTSTSDIDNEPKVTPKIDILFILQLLAILMLLLILLYNIILRKKYKKRPLETKKISNIKIFEVR